MKPPMNNAVTVISADKTQTPDRHGQYPEKRQATLGRVMNTTQVIRTVQGSYKQARIEIDLPPTITLQDGDKVEAVDNQGIVQKAQIIKVEEATNFAGNRTLYWTVYCE